MKVTLVRFIGDEFEVHRDVELPFVPHVGMVLVYRPRPGSRIEADDRLEVEALEWDDQFEQLSVFVFDQEGDGPEDGYADLRTALIDEFGWHDPYGKKNSN
ncbi:MAG TPA: hypothetical protein VGG64_14780 [Pirellulales bacterium]|jgi:hypothetical protein